MSRYGDVYENRVTGEYAVVLRGTEDHGDQPMLVHLIALPGARVAGEHVHPHMWERFTVVRGRLDGCIGGKPMSMGPGEQAMVEAGVGHDWWNASATEEAHVLIEFDAATPGFDIARFELLIGTLFGLANDGKVDRKGRPPLLHAAVIARAFADTIVFTYPPRVVQAAFRVLAALGSMLGYQPTEPRYGKPHGHVTPDPEIAAAAGLAPRRLSAVQ